MANIIFWQNCPSHHQSSLVRALATKEDIHVTLVAEETLPTWRVGLGWGMPDFGAATVIMQPDWSKLSGLFARYKEEDSVHIFSGIRGYPLVWTALQHYRKTTARIGIYSEAANWFGLKGRGRLIRSQVDAIYVRKWINFILAIGHLGEKWFVKCNYPSSLVYPFAYFVESAPQSDLENIVRYSSDSRVKLIFVGQCVYRKGLDTLLKALKTFVQVPWILKVIGDGENREEFEELSRILGIEQRVIFTGALPNNEAKRHISRSDLLILPSRWDGWGAVVNEALMCGVPVVCSSLCGAADLLRNAVCGSVFEAGSVTDLRRQLAHWLAKGPLTPERSAHIKDWAKNIQGEAAADYLLRVLAHVEGRIAERPIPPWLTAATATRTDAHFR